MKILERTTGRILLEIEGANLRGANLRDADLRDADLEDANLRDADLYGANLLNADLEGANLRSAKGIILFGPVPTSGRIGYAVQHEKCVMVQLGCFWDTAANAIKKVLEVHPNEKGKAYASLIRAAVRALKVA